MKEIFKKIKCLLSLHDYEVEDRTITEYKKGKIIEFRYVCKNCGLSTAWEKVCELNVSYFLKEVKDDN